MSTGKTQRRKNLLVDHPAWTERLSEEWDWEKNDEMGIKPDEVTAGSHKKAAWRCKMGHEWEAAVSSRVRMGCGCPYCSGLRPVIGESDLATIAPILASEWHPTRNGSLTPQDVTEGSGKKVWWLGKCGHEWEASVVGRTKGKGCPVCANRTLVQGVNDLQTTNPALITEWHPTRNEGTTPRDVTPGSGKAVWWLCPECGNEWRARVRDRAKGGRGCFNCGVKKRAQHLRTPKKGMSLRDRFPDIADEWHPTKNGLLTPEEVNAGTGRSVWWLCSECGHEWEASPNSRTTNNSGCPACAGNILVRGKNDLKSRFPGIASEWHPTKNGDLIPSKVSAASERKVWWLCPRCGHEYRTRIDHRTVMESGCPKCASSHGEKDAVSWAVSQNFVVDEQWRHPECRDKNPLPFDLMLYVPVGNALMEVSAIEYDGIHHSDETTYFNQKNLARGGISYVQRHDAIKTNFCLLSHRVLIRVPHTVTGKEAIGEYISGRLVENGLGWWLNDVNGDAA